GSDQRGEGRHRSALRTAEDGPQRRCLLVAGALVDVDGNRPVAVRHRPGSVRDQGEVEPVERHRAVAALIDVKSERDVAYSLGPAGNSFSTKTKTVIAAIHTRLMMPAANKSAIKNQQQPRQ